MDLSGKGKQNKFCKWIGAGGDENWRGKESGMKEENTETDNWKVGEEALEGDLKLPGILE